MRIVFADASYWIALSNPRDGLHKSAMTAGARLGPALRIVTSEMVLVETMNSLASLGSHSRRSVVRVVQEVIGDRTIDLVPQTPELFRQALALYSERSDKDWSLTDCASFLIMDERKITEALTHDRHFEQKGYRVLLRN